VVGVVFGLEKAYFANRKNSQKIQYDKIQLLKPKYTRLLHRDLSLRLGKEVIEVKIENVNFIEGHATLKVYYGDDYLIHYNDDSDQIILDHNEEIRKILNERENELSLSKTGS
jgi:dsDNA-specific endonuclease/ATPase MutS2